MASRPIFQLVLFGLCAYTWYRAGMEYQVIPTAGRFAAAQLRVTSLEARGCAEPGPCAAV